MTQKFPNKACHKQYQWITHKKNPVSFHNVLKCVYELCFLGTYIALPIHSTWMFIFGEEWIFPLCSSICTWKCLCWIYCLGTTMVVLDLWVWKTWRQCHGPWLTGLLLEKNWMVEENYEETWHCLMVSGKTECHISMWLCWRSTYF